MRKKRKHRLVLTTLRVKTKVPHNYIRGGAKVSRQTTKVTGHKGKSPGHEKI